jgi:hypothetical protein
MFSGTILSAWSTSLGCCICTISDLYRPTNDFPLILSSNRHLHLISGSFQVHYVLMALHRDLKDLWNNLSTSLRRYVQVSNSTIRSPFRSLRGGLNSDLMKISCSLLSFVPRTSRISAQSSA